MFIFLFFFVQTKRVKIIFMIYPRQLHYIKILHMNLNLNVYDAMIQKNVFDVMLNFSPFS